MLFNVPDELLLAMPPPWFARPQNTSNGKRKRASPAPDAPQSTVIQVVTGSYERVLHGFSAAIAADSESETVFQDTFLFNAHLSAVRCLALSPPSSHKRILATGSSDERVNLYALSTRAPKTAFRKSSGLIKEPSHGSRSRELGSLLNHSSTITSLSFPTHSKLLSSSNDNNIAITRTRDWTLLSTIHAPVPKSAGRPSGDTFAPGEVPAGINDLAVHPSAKLAITVGIGERCMRLWDLVKGKKAGVLTFEKNLLAQIGEAKYRGGEARQVVWRPDGAEFAVAFEKGILIFDVGCQVKSAICLGLRGRCCQIRYLPTEQAESTSPEQSLLAVSTEDGRVLIYDTEKHAALPIEESREQSNGLRENELGAAYCTPVAQLGAAVRGSNSRIKAFELLQTSRENGKLYAVTAGSDGRIQIWALSQSELHTGPSTKKRKETAANGALPPTTSKTATQPDVRQVGTLLGSFETRHRITCLAAFVMEPHVEQEDDDEDEDVNGNSRGEGEEEEGSDDDEDEDSGSDGGVRVIVEGEDDDDDDDDDDSEGFDGFDD